jgi:hypothetical protein
MIPGPHRLFSCLAALVALPLAAASPAPARTVSPQLMAAAECMARILMTMPGVADIEIDVPEGQGPAYPVLQYSSSDASGRRRFAELRLFEISGIDDAPYVFDRADIANDFVAARLLPEWKTRCRAGVGNITSPPG